MLGEAAAYKCLTQQWGGWDHPMGLSGPLGSLALSFPTWALSRLMSLFVTKSCVSILKQPQENWKFYNSCNNAERLSNIGLSSVFNDVWKKRCCVFLIRIYTFCVQLHDCLKQTQIYSLKQHLVFVVRLNCAYGGKRRQGVHELFHPGVRTSVSKIMLFQIGERPFSH